MNRPYVVCHMLSTLDGRISGDFMRSESNHAPSTEYGRLREVFSCDATLYGTVTMAEGFSDGYGSMIHSGESPSPFSREDYIAMDNAGHYIVSIDPSGQLAFHGNTIHKKGRPEAHIIEVLTHAVNDPYLACLRDLSISCIFAGEEKLDCTLALQKLKDCFGIERLLVAGGGVINGTLLKDDLIDEMSIVLSSVIEGDRSAASLVDYSISGRPSLPATFALIEAKPLANAVWLRYQCMTGDVCL